MAEQQIAFTILFILLYSSTIYSQNWFWQNLPQDYDLSSIDFVLLMIRQIVQLNVAANIFQVLAMIL